MKKYGILFVALLLLRLDHHHRYYYCYYCCGSVLRSAAHGRTTTGILDWLSPAIKCV